jgi:Na+/melibiose symporter-like transporter
MGPTVAAVEPEVKETEYNKAKVWQIAMFATNNTATNMYNFMMGFIAYYATGIAGLLVVVVSTLMTSMRLFNAVTDPIVGFLIDKTNGKIGKFRPFLIIGNIILASTVLLLFNTVHLVPEGFRLLYFILIYAIYDIGYSFQSACTKSAQTVVTNDPKQRPLFSLFDGMYTMLFYSLAAIYVSNYLTKKHGDFTMGLFQEFNVTFIVVSAFLTTLAVIGIWKKDRPENFGLGANNNKKVSFKEYWPILKGNRALQMLIISGASDKLCSNINRNAATGVMLFGIIIGNYAISGYLSIVSMIPGLIFVLLGTMIARKVGQKKTFVGSVWISLIFYGLIVILLVLGDPSQIAASGLNFTKVAFYALFILSGVQGISDSLIITMIADTADYETYRSGRFVPGMIGTAFSFVDKLISSLAATIVGVMVAAIGFTTAMPSLEDTLTQGIWFMGIFLYFGMPMISWIISLIAMKFYPLDKETMAEIQQVISDKKHAVTN